MRLVPATVAACCPLAAPFDAHTAKTIVLRSGCAKRRADVVGVLPGLRQGASPAPWENAKRFFTNSRVRSTRPARSAAPEGGARSAPPTIREDVGKSRPLRLFDILPPLHHRQMVQSRAAPVAPLVRRWPSVP